MSCCADFECPEGAPLGSISLGALYEPVALTLEFRGTLYELAQKADLECPVVAQGAMHTSQ